MTENNDSREEFVNFLLQFNTQSNFARTTMLNNPKFTLGLAGSAISNFIDLNGKYISINIGSAGLFDAITVSAASIENLVECFDQILMANDIFTNGSDDDESVEYLVELSKAMQTLSEGMTIMKDNLREVQDTFNEPNKDYIKDFRNAHAFYLAQKAEEIGEPESIIDEDTLQATLAEWMNKEKNNG